MAKPERHPWPYGPQLNYYPPAVLNLPKKPLPNASHVNTADNYFSIRYPEPRRPYHVPYPTFNPYCHQENHPVGSYIQPSTICQPKHYVHRPIPHDNFSNSYKYTENIQGFPAAYKYNENVQSSNSYSSTKEPNTCYQTTWNNTSQYSRNPPELDVRRFLATWQDKDDDSVDVSTEDDQNQIFPGPDSIPLDCSKRNNPEKNIKKNSDDIFMTGHIPNPPGFVVQPYYIREEKAPSNRNIRAENEMNNKVPYRNNRNYGVHTYHSKTFYSNAENWKHSNNKLFPCEYNMAYNHTNHCDVNMNQMRSNFNYTRQKNHGAEPPERSHYNLTSSLESGELFCDINNRTDEQQKHIVQPGFHDILNPKINGYDEHTYFQQNNDLSENVVYSELHSNKDPWDMFSSNVKFKESMSDKTKPSINKVQSNFHFDTVLSSSNNHNSGSIIYEGAFNILPNITGNNLEPTQYTSNSNVIAETDVSGNSSVHTETITPPKTPLNVIKSVQSNSKIKPFHFNEAISSEDIDISITSSGDLIVEEEPSNSSVSVISFSKAKKEKPIPPYFKNDKINEIAKSTEYHVEVLKEHGAVKSSPVHCENTDLTNHILLEKSIKEVTESDGSDSTQSKRPNDLEVTNDDQNSNSSVKNNDLNESSIETQNTEENPLKNEADELSYLDISTNYFEPCNEKKIDESRSEIDENRSDNSSDSLMYDNITSDELITKIQSDLQEKVGKVNNNMIISPLHQNYVAIENLVVNTTNITTNYNIKTPEVISDVFDITSNVVTKTSAVVCRSPSFASNDNLLLLAHCSQKYGCQIPADEVETNGEITPKRVKCCNENQNKSCRDLSVLKCSLRWDKIFNVMTDEDTLQPDMSLDLGPAKVELRMPSDSYSAGHWKIVEADNKVQTSSIVQVKRLILKRKSQNEERIPKMIIKKTEGQEYRSYLKRESTETVLNCGKLKIYYDISSKSKSPKNCQVQEMLE